MITFRDVVRRESTTSKLDRLAGHLARGDAEAAFLEAGELEQGVLDALRPVRDGWGGVERRLRALSRAAGAAYLAQREGDPARARRHLEGAECAAGRLLAPERHRSSGLVDLPPILEVRAPEGYHHYALDPIGYARAAERYARDVGRDRATRAVVVGVRSIGTSLAGIVDAALGADRGLTVRPRGPSGSRRVVTDARLEDTLLAWLEDGGDALIVDEGPGMTGETFVCVAAWLRGLGVAPERIVLFPSHLAPPSLGDAEVREFFERSRRYAPPPDDDRVERLCASFGLSRPVDLSAGRWRDFVPDAGGAPVIPRHERLKFLAHDRHRRPFLIRYGGLGRAGEESIVRARSLESAGYGPEIVGRENGFVVTAWVEGRAARPDTLSGRDFMQDLVAYLTARAPLFRTGTTVDIAPILTMLHENASETLPTASQGLGAALRRLERLPPREAAIPDARLQPHEWIRAPDRYLKLDATDHGDGVRLPGPADPAWDLAGAAVEYGLDSVTVDELIRRCAPGARNSSACGAAELAAAVRAYRAPYIACQLGETTLGAREALDARERRILERECERYRGLLEWEFRC